MKIFIIAASAALAAGGLWLVQTQAQKAPPAKAVNQSYSPLYPGGNFPTEPDRNFASLAVAHAAYTEDFAKKPGFGSSRIVFLPGQDFVTVSGKTYRFTTPELVGLENEPIVYQLAGGVENISVAVMSKAELRSRLTRRALTVTESNAVVELRAGKDLVTRKEQVQVYGANGKPSHAAGIRAVGALRAQDNCAHCHGVPKGTLLGAFSYTLTPTNVVAMSTPSRQPSPRPTLNPPANGTNLNFTAISLFDLLLHPSAGNGAAH